MSTDTVRSYDACDLRGRRFAPYRCDRSARACHAEQIWQEPRLLVLFHGTASIKPWQGTWHAS